MFPEKEIFILRSQTRIQILYLYSRIDIIIFSRKNLVKRYSKPYIPDYPNIGFKRRNKIHQMKEKVIRATFLTIFLLIGHLAAYSQLEVIHDLGWFEDSDFKKLNINLIAKNEKPSYVEIPSSGDGTSCYVPYNKMNDFRKYLNEIIEISEEWEKSAVSSPEVKEERQIDIPGPSVWMYWKGDNPYNRDESYEGWNNLSASWEFDRIIGGKPRSYITLTTKVTDQNDTDEFRIFKIKVSVDIMKSIEKNILAKNHVEGTGNTYLKNLRIMRKNRSRFR